MPKAAKPAKSRNCLASGFGCITHADTAQKNATIKAEGLHLTAEAPKFLHGRLGPDDQPNVAILRAPVALLSTTP